jgi:DNA invertase Pin-like site-specific DNA recombinase
LWTEVVTACGDHESYSPGSEHKSGEGERAAARKARAEARALLYAVAAIAQHEREMIAQRTREAPQAAKARGKRLGNPYGLKANQENADRFAANVMPVIRQIQESGVVVLEQNTRACVMMKSFKKSRR